MDSGRYAPKWIHNIIPVSYTHLGWLVKVKLTDPKECESLLTDAQYKELIG